jgi:hypothetical protein
MSWLITGTQKIDPDAAVYLSRVEAADGQVLEAGVRTAVDQFVLGCKADGIWPAIKASCILAGARTLSGALVPLAGGVAPTNVGPFVSGDYNRKTGLFDSTNVKYLESGRLNNADPLNSQHLSVFISNHDDPSSLGNNVYIGTQFDVAGSTVIARSSASARGGYLQSRTGSLGITIADTSARTGFHGLTRSTSTQIVYRRLQSSTTYSQASVATSSEPINVFRGGSSSVQAAARLAFYSIGESLDLALLDTRVTTLINAFGTAIP